MRRWMRWTKRACPQDCSIYNDVIVTAYCYTHWLTSTPYFDLDCCSIILNVSNIQFSYT